MIQIKHNNKTYLLFKIPLILPKPNENVKHRFKSYQSISNVSLNEEWYIDLSM